ncbi:hypothetical protein ACFL6C_03465 [Myxococcota bacterium]
MKHFWGMSVALPPLLLLLGCDGAADGQSIVEHQCTPQSFVEPYASSGSYCELVVECYCDFYRRCDWIAVDTHEACRERFLETCNGRYEPAYVALTASGLLRLSTSGLSACQSHLAVVTCSEHAGDLQGPCSTMWEGQQPLGGACGMGSAGIENMVCGPGTRCVVDLSFCGTCEGVAPLGEPCASDSDCSVDAACEDDTCIARAGLGDPCDVVPCVREARCQAGRCLAKHSKSPLGATCASILDCQYATACVNGTCVPSASLGEACDSSTPCDAGHCDASGACTPLIQAGGSCQESAQCVSGRCDNSRCDDIPGPCFQ